VNDSALSRRIIRFSSNLLATAVIIILGLTLGRQVLHWWQSTSPGEGATDNIEVDHLAQLADPQWPHRITFGELPLAFDRVSFVGSQQQALERLRTRCRELARSEASDSAAWLPASNSVLQQLAEREPVEQGPGWQLVQHVGPVITVVGLRTRPNDATKPADSASQNRVSVVSWGLGLRATTSRTDEAISDVRWTLLVCSGPGQASGSNAARVIALPPHSKRTFTAEVQGGGALIGFAGPDTSSSYKAFFDRSLNRQKWHAAAGWKQIGQSWHARFAKRDGSTCDIQLVGGATDTATGILTIDLKAQEQGNQPDESVTGPRDSGRTGRGGSGL
jgi:hypothetical protein